ncbi:MAG: hypothetical protein IKG99_07310 [Bacteroidaceae bacterium]|nr:hypothetical protein [Bacteroidaceae bacterium]
MNLQIIYQSECFEPSTPDFHNGWLNEMDAMRKCGISVSDTPHPEAEQLLYRSYMISEEKDFPTDPRYISRWQDYHATNDMSVYLPLIQDLTIPSFVTYELNRNTVATIKSLGWKRAFVRSSVKSLKYMFPESHTEEDLPVWPDVSIERLAEAYKEERETLKPPYIVRQFMPKQTMFQEDRYWIIKHHAYHRSGIIPEVVAKAVERLKTLNAPYYVIDATPDFVVEVNPGVSSDPYPENIPLFFPRWIKKEFALGTNPSIRAMRQS